MDGTSQYHHHQNYNGAHEWSAFSCSIINLAIFWEKKNHNKNKINFDIDFGFRVLAFSFLEEPQ